MTINEIASAIRNNIGNGLKEVDDYSYSLAQIRDEISNTRNAIILQASQSGILNPAQFSQKMLNIPLNYSSFPYGGETYGNNSVPHVKIRKLVPTADNSSVLYIGPADFSVNFKKYFDSSFNTHKYSRVIKNRPYVYIDMAHDSEGYNDAYFFNLNSSGLKQVAIQGVFADPVAILDEDGVFGEDEEFPCPSSVQSQIIDTITEKYVKYYKQLNHPYQPNTNTDQK